MGRWAWLLFVYVLLGARPILGAPSDGPGKGTCHPECLKYGNCGDDGMCRCPFGRLGDGCEIDFLAPCKQRPDGIPSCGEDVTKSCECLRRCRWYFCGNNSTKDEVFCGKGRNYPPDRGCYMRNGVQPEAQFSSVPEENETSAKYLRGYPEDAKEITRDEALFWKTVGSLPLSKCPAGCSSNGYCVMLAGSKQAVCRCYRGYAGSTCELEIPSCTLDCSGRGKCIDHFCHCKPPYFSIGCSRSKVYPKKNSRPSPVGFKVYMYDLSTRDAYEIAYHVGWTEHDPNYIAYQKFLARFLVSNVRTEDPSEAALFYIPAFIFSYSGNGGSGREHARPLFDHIRNTWPYWNRTGGRDHFVWTPTDRGACDWGSEPMSSLIRVTHFGMHSTRTNYHQHFGHMGHPDWGCYHPLKDVVAVPYDVRMPKFLADTPNITLEERFLIKKRLFFFSGAIREDPAYAGNTRRVLDDLVKRWNDPDFTWDEAPTANYHLAFQETKFCLAPYGHGWGMRLHQSILGGCVPVVIQEHVFQPYEDLLPYETFSLRLNNADLPFLREILRGVSDEQYKHLLAGVFRYRHALHWEAEHHGGQAFHYTIASLRRRHQHLQSSLY